MVPVLQTIVLVIIMTAILIICCDLCHRRSMKSVTVGLKSVFTRLFRRGITQTLKEAHTMPEILELFSELEKRDKDSKGQVQPGSLAGAGLGDPRGFGVQNPTGNQVGKVDDLYVDPHTRLPHFALLSLGNHALGIGNRRVLVAYDDLTVIGNKVVQVKRALGGL